MNWTECRCTHRASKRERQGENVDWIGSLRKVKNNHDQMIITITCMNEWTL